MLEGSEALQIELEQHHVKFNARSRQMRAGINEIGEL
jgi:hypothetical protein